VTFYPNCVIKFATNAYLLMYGPILNYNGASSPAILTSKDDDAYGDIIIGSSSNPTYAASKSIWIYYETASTTMSYMKIRWAQTGIYYDATSGSGITHYLNGVSIRKCQLGIYNNSCVTVVSGVTACSVSSLSNGSNGYVSGTITSDCEGDSDSDGLPDSWETQYCGSITAQDQNGDPDGDGFTNLQEYRAGTNPTQPSTFATPTPLPPVGAAYLRIVSPTVLELVRITSNPDATEWANFGGSPPATSAFQVTANGSQIAVQQVGFKRRPMYQSYPDTSDFRVEDSLYLSLASSIADNAAVQVNNSASLWPSSMSFTTVQAPLRYGPAIHVNQEGYQVHVSYDGGSTLVPAPQKATIGYYCGSLTAPVQPASIAQNAYIDQSGWPPKTFGGQASISYGPVNFATGFGVVFPSTTLSASFINAINNPQNPNAVNSIGFLFNVTAQMKVTHLARWVYGGDGNQIPRNSRTHNVKLVDSGNHLLGSVLVDTSVAAPGQYAWVRLATPVTLNVGTYYLLSEEVDGGDYWYNYDCQLVARGAGQIDFSAIGNSSVKLVDATTGNQINGFFPSVVPAPTEDPKTISDYDGSQYQGLWEVDFHGFATPGDYRLQVDGLGASYPFRIEDTLSMKLARTYALGLYHQRCGSGSGVNYTGGTALPITRITGSGTGATITPTIANGIVTGGSIPNGGSGWNVSDTFTFADATGTGFIGTVATVSGGALTSFIVHQVDDLPFTRFTHGNCHTVAATVMVPQSSYVKAWDIINGNTDPDGSTHTGYANHPDPNQRAPQLIGPDSPHMIFQFSQVQNAGNNGHEIVDASGNGRAIDVSGGHHDAGDYSKYTINSAHLIHNLVFAADTFPNVAGLDNLGIPESGDGRGDILQEAKWEADFLLKMQDRGTARDSLGRAILDSHGVPVPDGGFFTLVYPQNREYEDNVTPDHGDSQIVWPKTTAVTAAALGALAEIGSSRAFCSQFGLSPTDWQNNPYLVAALNGWGFLMRAFDNQYSRGSGKDNTFQTLYNYGKDFMHNDELAWAAAAMFAAGYSDANSNHDPHSRLKAWFPSPLDLGNVPFGYSCIGDNPPCNSWYYGWWGMYLGYGCAIRDYAFAVSSGRRAQGDMTGSYFADCQAAVTKWGHIVRSWSEKNPYRTDISTSDQGYHWNPQFYFPGYFAFDIAVADRLDTIADDHARNTAAVLGSFNFELGNNPNNVGFLPGLGIRRPRVVVNQYWYNAGHVLPPTGNPIGGVNDFQATLDSVLKPVFYPAAGNAIGFPVYDRWADARTSTSEFVGVQTARSLAAAAWLAVQISANRSQQWRSADIVSDTGTISPSFSVLSLYSPQTVSLTSALSLTAARVVWDLPGQLPAFGTSFTFIPSTIGENRLLQAEAVFPDGRRVFASRNFAIYDPINGGANYTSDGNTIALYHFDADLTTDSGPNGYNLTVHNSSTTAPILANNTTWMNTFPNSSYHVARFSNRGDSLTVSIPACVIMPPTTACSTTPAHPLTIEARIYPRAYRSDGLAILKLAQDDTGPTAAQWTLYYDQSQSQDAPGIVANCCSGSGCCPFVTGSLVKAALTLNTWHRLMITYNNSSGVTKAYVDGVLQGSSSTPPMSDTPTADWLLTLGNFDGDIDEVRISKVLRTP
jgi:hypothetical protein